MKFTGVIILVFMIMTLLIDTTHGSQQLRSLTTSYSMNDCNATTCDDNYTTCESAIAWVQCEVEECQVSKSECLDYLPLIREEIQLTLPDCTIPDSVCGSTSVSASIFTFVISYMFWNKE